MVAGPMSPKDTCRTFRFVALSWTQKAWSKLMHFAVKSKAIHHPRNKKEKKVSIPLIYLCIIFLVFILSGDTFSISYFLHLPGYLSTIIRRLWNFYASYFWNFFYPSSMSGAVNVKSFHYLKFGVSIEGLFILLILLFIFFVSGNQPCME